MDFIINNWFIILVAVIAMVIYTEEQLKKLREWLIYAAAIAEKQFGSGTGALKLRHVYDMFIKMFPWLSMIIPFERFSEMVDSVLVKMDKMLDDNSAIQTYVKGTEE